MKEVFFLTFLVFSAVLPVNGQSWVQQQKLMSSDRSRDDAFGSSISVDGNYAVIGTPVESEGVDGSHLYLSGSVYVFERDDNGVWNEVQKLVPSDRDERDYFGASVAVSGNYILVGAYQDEGDESNKMPLSSAGSAYIFERDDAGSWIEVQKIVASDRQYGDQFGRDVSIDGNFALIGSIRRSYNNGEVLTTNPGTAYVFEKTLQDKWVEVKKLKSSYNEGFEGFGKKVSISENYAIIGASQQGADLNNENFLINSGAVYIYKYENGTWGEPQKLVASDRSAHALFGTDVAIDNELAVIGAIIDEKDANGINELEYAGSAYIFEKEQNGNLWKQKLKLVPSDRQAGDQFGASVEINEKTVIVGAPIKTEVLSDSSEASSSGAAYIFNLNEANDLLEEYKIVPHDKEAHDWFGKTVAISNQSIMVGAIYKDELVDENPLNKLQDVGATYTFDFSDVTSIRHSVQIPSLRAYPNPMTESFRIKLSKEFPHVEVVLSNIYGQVLSQKSYQSVDEVTMSIDDVPGYYIVNINLFDQGLRTVKILKK